MAPATVRDRRAADRRAEGTDEEIFTPPLLRRPYRSADPSAVRNSAGAGAGPVADAVAQVTALALAGNEEDLIEGLLTAATTLCSATGAAVALYGPAEQVTALTHRGMTPAQLMHLQLAPPRPPAPPTTSEARLSHPPVVLEEAFGAPGRATGKVWIARDVTAGGFTDQDRAVLGALATAAGAALTALRVTHATSDVLATLTTALSSPEPAHAPTDASSALTESPAAGASAGSTARTAPIEGPRGAGCGDIPLQVATAPVVRQLVASARTLLGTQTAFLSRVHHAASPQNKQGHGHGHGHGQTVEHSQAGSKADRQTFVVVASGPNAPTVREGDTIDPSQGYCSLMLSGAIPSVVADLRVHPLTALMPVTAATGAGTYCGVPVHLPDGSLYGTLCGLDRDTDVALDAQQIQALRTLANLIGTRLALGAREHQHLQNRRRRFAPFLSGHYRRTVIQPIIDLREGTTAGYEALSRFTDTTGQARRPDHVFSEATGLDLGVQLEHAAASSALDLLPLLPQGVYLSVNFSPRTLLAPGTSELLAAHRLDRVVIELTEHEEVTSYAALQQALAGLRAAGARLAIDDTGAGFAGLQHLAQLVPDIVKLDISFVRDIDIDPTRRAVARAMSSFAAEIGARLVAEGIETVDERSVLQELGATHGQGYLLGRPAAPLTYTGQAGITEGPSAGESGQTAAPETRAMPLEMT